MAVTDMTSKERIVAAVEHRQPDRVPIMLDFAPEAKARHVGAPDTGGDMQTIVLPGKRVRCRLDVKAHELSVERDGHRLPWRIDLGQTTALTTGQLDLADSHRSYPVDLGALELRRLTETHLQWIGQIGGAGVALEIEVDGDAIVLAITPIGTGSNQVISAVWPGAIGLEGTTRESI